MNIRSEGLGLNSPLGHVSAETIQLFISKTAILERLSSPKIAT